MHMHQILGSFSFCFTVSCTFTVYPKWLLSPPQSILLVQQLKGKVPFQGKETACREMLRVISYDQNLLLPIAFSCVLVFVFLTFFLCSIVSSFIISLLCWPLEYVLGFFFCPLSHCFSLVPILPSVTSNVFICGLDQCSSNFFKVLFFTGFHGNPRVPGVGRMSSAYALLKLFYHRFTIPFECFHEKNIWESLS